MGFLDELKKLTRPYDEDEEDFIDEADPAEEPEEPVFSNPFSSFATESRRASAAQQPTSAPRTPREGRIVSLGNAGGQFQVVLIKPERFETAAEIADHLRSKHAVLVNMETTPKEMTRRLVDFLSGVTYAIDGNIKKVASNTYIITPPNINLVDDLMDELESSGVYF
ncbi:MAG: cell division protein SepF [Oscillospiraceae bacterium]|nr:cell division protein SepF [Oscillospiraceae bacterium]